MYKLDLGRQTDLACAEMQSVRALCVVDADCPYYYRVRPSSPFLSGADISLIESCLVCGQQSYLVVTRQTPASHLPPALHPLKF